MITIEVYYVFSESGYFQEYYRTVKTNRLICKQDEIWHTCIDDNCWNECIAPIDMSKYEFLIVKKPEGEPVG